MGRRVSSTLKGNGLVFEMMAQESDADAILDEGAHVDRDADVRTRPLPDFAGFQHLLDGGQQAVAVGEHARVELAALGIVELTALQGFEVEMDGRDGRLQLVGDRAEKSVMAFVAADFADEKDGVEGDADDEEREKRNPERHGDDATPVKENPADVERDGHADEAHAEQR